ncbi:MAG: response regulator [Acidobacteria bacterium]|nr:response regulator [Acidobacteriota bacterium]
MVNAEEFLLVPELFISSALDSLSTHIAILDAKGTIISVNKSWKTFAQENYGYLSKLLPGVNYFQVCSTLTGKDALHTKTFVQNIKDIIIGINSEFQIEQPYFSTTKQYWFLSKVTRFCIGQEVFLVVVYEDITRLKFIEQKFIETQVQLNSLVESNIIGLTNWQLDGGITKANNAFLKMTGYTEDDVLAGKINCKALTPPEYSELDKLAFKELKEYGRYSPFEKEYFCKDGSKIPVLVVGAMFFNSKETGFSYILDLRELKALQAQLIQAQKMESIATLASGIAHDLNNILSPVLMFLHLLRKKLTQPKDLKTITTIENTVKRGSDLVRQVLSLTRKNEANKERIDFYKLLTELKLLIRETFPKSINLNIDMEKNLSSVVGNNTEIHQVILNLCINARDAMPQGGQLVITVKNVFIDESYQLKNCDSGIGEHVLISIADTGTGISPDNLDKIFTPFFTTKSSEKGTGLGLPIVLRIIKNHGGFINVNTEIELGSEFNIYLPVYKQTTAERLQITEEEIIAGQGETILVVDDEETLRELTKMILELYQYKVLTASNGADAVATYAINKDKVSLVITDLMMTDMEGLDAINALRKINPQLKIMVITGSVPTYLMEQFKEQNIPFLTKPFTAQKLLKNIHNLLL